MDYGLLRHFVGTVMYEFIRNGNVVQVFHNGSLLRVLHDYDLKDCHLYHRKIAVTAVTMKDLES